MLLLIISAAVSVFLLATAALVMLSGKEAIEGRLADVSRTSVTGAGTKLYVINEVI